MTHLSVREWGRIKIGNEGFSVSQAEKLVAAACNHPLGGQNGGEILSEHRYFLQAKQMVGVIAAENCSLEILPKVDPETADEDTPTLRRNLLTLLDLALGLNLGIGEQASIAYGANNLLDIIIHEFAQQLLTQTRRGLPRHYTNIEEDLPSLHGTLNLIRQFTVHAVRPDRLSCRYDTLSSDIPLIQIMKATVNYLSKICRSPTTRRLLDELHIVMVKDITDLPPTKLPWDKVHIDRTNKSWERLFAIARLIMKRDWQKTHHKLSSKDGFSLLFPMNELFESAVTNLFRRTLSGSDIEVVAQGGLRGCLGEWNENIDCTGNLFKTKPDILLKSGTNILAVIDTKWKCISYDPLDRKKGVNQADIYQMMAYARLYNSKRLMLLYPTTPGNTGGIVRRFGIHGGQELLALGRIDITTNLEAIQSQISALIHDLIGTKQLQHSPKLAKMGI